MPDEKENFKVTDRRRYNPDGSLRESAIEEEKVEEPAEQVEATTADANEEAANTANIVAFPGAANKPPTESTVDEEPTVEDSQPTANKAAAASATASSQKAQQSAQAAAVENAYNQVAGSRPSAKQSQALFFNLLNMLAVEAAMSLGLMEMEPGVRSPVDLETARQIIDMLGMLKEKTAGNLANDEEALLEQVLADLRMQFVALSRRSS